MDDWKSNSQICIVRIKPDDEFAAAFAIDGRKYSTKEEFKRKVIEAFDWINSSSIIAEFETSPVGAEEPALQLPSWEQYRDSHGPVIP